MTKPGIDIIIPHFEDPRITRAIRSVLGHPQSTAFRLIVQDGGHDVALRERIKSLLREQDWLIAEDDRGIFDALNKGLDKSNADWVGWMGADDFLSSTFNVVELFSAPPSASFVSFKTVFFAEHSYKIVREYPPVQSAWLRRSGMHVPHFSTYVRRSAIGNLRFDLEDGLVADILFFIKLETSASGIASTSLSTYMSEGGASNASWRSILRMNYSLFILLANRFSHMYALRFIILKLAYKCFQRITASILRRRVDRAHNFI